MKIGELELNNRRKEKPLTEYDNELFSFWGEQVDYCREIDRVDVVLDHVLDHDLDHRRVAIPEETQKRLGQLIDKVREKDPWRSLDYLNNLNIHYEPLPPK